MTSRLKNVKTPAGSYDYGSYPGEHELILYGKAAEPAVLKGRGTETHLSAEDIREHVLVFVAEHPDEFEGSVRAITELWDKDRENHLNHGIHTFSLSDRERRAIRQAVTEREVRR
jgi:hypothetical protein